MMERGVSVVVCCYNSAARVTKALQHLAAQITSDSFHWEIVLVDNASTDNTQQIATQAWQTIGKQGVELRCFLQPKRGLSYARELGVGAAKYPVIIFCDDDNWLNPDYVQAAFDIMSSDPSIGALGGVGIPVADLSFPPWFEKYKYSFACYPQAEQDGEVLSTYASLYGAGMCLRREAFDALQKKGFQPMVTGRLGTRLSSGEDTELCFAIRLSGYRLWYSNKLSFYHHMPATRLSEQYLMKLNQSLSVSQGKLLVYKYVLQGKKVTNWLWYKDMLFQLLFLTKNALRFLNVKPSYVERKLALDFSYHSLKSILSQFGKYEIQSERIAKLKN